MPEMPHDLGCDLDCFSYHARQQIAVIVVPIRQCPDMSGAIALVERVGPCRAIIVRDTAWTVINVYAVGQTGEWADRPAIARNLTLPRQPAIAEVLRNAERAIAQAEAVQHEAEQTIAEAERQLGIRPSPQKRRTH